MLMAGGVIRMLVAGVRLISPQLSDSTSRGHALRFWCQVIALHGRLVGSMLSSVCQNLGLGPGFARCPEPACWWPACQEFVVMASDRWTHKSAFQESISDSLGVC